MRRITALDPVAASSTNYAAHALDPWTAAPQQLLASYAQGRMKSSARGFCQDSAKFLGALAHPSRCETTSQNIWFIYQTSTTIFHITSSPESVDATHFDAQLCLIGLDVTSIVVKPGTIRVRFPDGAPYRKSAR